MGMMDEKTLANMGFGHVGKGCLISDKASFYNCANIFLGDYCRIDDFCVLSAGQGGIHLGNRIHIAVFSSLIGQGRISLGDYANISSRVAVYSSSDDYSGQSMTNPMVPEQFTGVEHAPVAIGKHVIIGSGSVILPGVVLHEGVSVGALTLIKSDCEPYTIYAGNPARKIGQRSEELKQKEQALKAWEAGQSDS